MKIFPQALLAFFALFSALSQAFSANDTAMLFLNQSETGSMQIVPFPSGSANYFMVKTGGSEMLVLQQREGGFFAVEGEGALEALVQEYKRSGKKALSNETVEMLKAEITELNATYQYCAVVMTAFLNKGTLLYQILYLDDLGSPDRIPYTANAVNRIGGNYTYFKNGTKMKVANGSAEILNAGFKEASDAAGLLADSQSSQFELSEKLNSFFEKISQMKAIANEYTTDFAYLRSRHPEMLNKRVCLLSAKSFEPMETALEEAGAIKNASLLAQKIAQETSARKPAFESKKALLEYKQDYESLAIMVREIETALSYANVTPSALKRKMSQLERTMDNLRNARSLVDARSEQDEFRTVHAKALAEAKTAIESGLLEQINQSVAAVGDAKALVDKAEENGASGQELEDAKKKYQSLKTELDDALFWVEFGGQARASPEEFANITIKAREFANATTGLATKSTFPFGIKPEALALPAIAILAIATSAYFILGRKQKQGL